MKNYTVSINKAHFPVTVLGYGRRIGIWFQGCDIRCPGCISQDTWDDDPGREIAVESLVAWCRSVSDGNLDGITITGGEPFHQSEALACLLEKLHGWRKESGAPFDILCYSGHSLSLLEDRYQDILHLLDVLVPEPYQDTVPMENPLCGSGNQKVVPISPIGVVRYGHLMPTGLPGRMQVVAKDGRMWFIGIPERGDMEKLDKICKSKGLTLEGVSWRP